MNVRQAINCTGHQLIGFWGGALTFLIQRSNLLKLSIKEGCPEKFQKYKNKCLVAV